MGRLIEESTLRDREYVFADRTAAGRLLATRLLHLKERQALLYAIPAGGVPVAAEIARVLKIPLDLIIVRKIQLPWTTEAGFGALDPGGEAIFNQELLQSLSLTPAEIQRQVEQTLANLRDREERLRSRRPYPQLEGRPTIVVDDGLASGYTMRAAVKFLKRQGAGPMFVAVPTGSARTVQSLLPLVEELVCLNVRGGFSFAVAAAYENWYDLTESEVLEILEGLKG
jgi:predicted phosphoribosyltransferase